LGGSNRDALFAGGNRTTEWRLTGSSRWAAKDQ
jgi:hypothetical protein